MNMKKNIAVALALASVVCAHAQDKKYPEPEGMRPGMTEFWTPQRKVVTPGDIKTNSAPSDAIVLFDGKNLDAWHNGNGGPAEWIVKNGVVTVDKTKGDIVTRKNFGSFQLHLEWCVPADINGMTGSIYKQTPPQVNAMRKPGEWNVYDIIYTAPVFKEDGTYLYRPRVTVIHNGVVLQNNTEILGTTEYIGIPKVVPHGDGPIRLQMHGDPSKGISFRNIWIREMK